MHKLNVALDGGRSYPILISSALVIRTEPLSLLAEALEDAARVVVVTNTTVGPLYAGAMTQQLAELGKQATTIEIGDGEEFKNAETLNQIYGRLLELRCDRRTRLIALGGGVVGDLTGFAAATYQRGIPFIQVPTTLLSQVDSSVGGKTGINHPRGKNMIGAFWQPKLVLADTDTLTTLPDRELSAGMAEVIKYGLIRDLPFLEWLESNMDQLMSRNPEALAYAIERSCQNKAEVVAGDELETAKDGGRALLNLGHTFGHAIETGVGYGEWLHGEAVGAGMFMAADLSRRMGWLADADVERVRGLLLRANLPVSAPRLGAERYLDLMSHDKKVLGGRLRLVLLKSIGDAITYADATPDQIKATIDSCCAN